ncbi:mediator of RNA polymerase II transcription subunit 33A-like isoform X2 [Miscanthus floridulus]|uniref:mediator of RNA polymerase II transcription subunit 33A-like isoform X2 n=1 Tax=Miscanthus floridulus TaxID=154761 RepID=UPI00345A1C1A
MAAAVTELELERRVMAAVKASAERGDPPLLQAAEAARCIREAPASAPGGLALSQALVTNLCFAHNTAAMWKLLDQAMLSRLVDPLHTLALLTPRVVPNRREQPEAYRLYLELLGRYAVAPVYPERMEKKDMLAKSIDSAMQLSHRFGFQHLDFGHTVILFVLSLVNMLIDCILDDCGLPITSADEHGNRNDMNFNGKGRSLDRGDEHREHLRRKNILMSIEVVEKVTANKIVQVFLRLVNRNIPENFSCLLRKLHLIGAVKKKNTLSPYNLLDSLIMNIQNVISTDYQLDRKRLLGVPVSIQPCSSAVYSIFRAGKGSCWIPFDMFMENAMDGRHLHAISSVEYLTELSKTLQVLNRATWQETFQALWISALRLVQRGPDASEGPFPHLDSRLCMLLAIIPLSIATIVKEEVGNLEGDTTFVIRGQLVSSLQILRQFFGLLSPPPAAVHLANTAARKAAVVLSNLKNGSENMYSSFKDSPSTKAVGNMLHLIVEACITRNLIDTSAYFWPGYVVPLKESSPVQESPWPSLVEGSPLIELKDALMVTPASRVGEIVLFCSKWVTGGKVGSFEDFVWSITSSWLEHSEGRYVQDMPMLHALVSGISSIDTVHILSMYGLVPEVASILMPLCEFFGSLPPSDHRSCKFEEASVYSVFSCAFLSLLRFWKFHRPPIENALSRRGVSVWSELHLDFLLLLRNSHSSLKNLSNVTQSSIFKLDIPFQKPVYIDSFPKLRAWYFQNQACIASTLSSACSRTTVLHVANMILKIICHNKVPKGGVLSVNPQSTENSSTSSSPSGVQEDMCQWPTLPAWEILEAVPFVLEAVLTSCAHGRLSSRDLVTGLRDLADFLPASLPAIVSYFSAEVTRGIWKPVMLNGVDWPSPAATLPVVESEIKEVLAFAGVHINICPRPRSVMPMLPLPIAALMSLSITVKMEEFSHLHGIIGQGIEICTTSSSWPAAQIIGALWSQKVRRWHDFIILTCSQSPFTRDNTAVAQLIRSCFSSFLGPLVDGRSCFVANRGVANLLGQTFDEKAHRLAVAPGFLYMRSCWLFPNNSFVCEEILEVVIERAHAIANACSSDRPARLRSDSLPLSAASSLVEQIASLAATMLCHAGGVNLIRLLYEQIIPTLLLSGGEAKLGSAGQVCSIIEGYTLAYVLLFSGARIWGVGETSPAYTSIYTSKRQRVVDRHLEFMARVMEGNIVLGCGDATWRSYVLCFVNLLVNFVPTWIPEVKLKTLQKLASGLQRWHEGDLALSLLERGGTKTVTSVVESLLQ